MSPVLEEVLAGSNTAGEPIKVDIDALWRKALEDGSDPRPEDREKYADLLDDMGEFAVISAWARGKGKKG